MGDEDSERLYELIEKNSGKKLPNASASCSFEGLRENTVDEGVLGFKNSEVTEMLEKALDHSDDLKRRMCAVYYHDIVCGGYKMPLACAKSPDLWLQQAVDDLMNDAPVKFDSDEYYEEHHQGAH